jgi:hypothetical protein
VCDFPGNVNLFHCSIHYGQAYVSSVPFELQEPPPREVPEAYVYVRPHQLDIQHAMGGLNSLPANVHPPASVAL